MPRRRSIRALKPPPADALLVRALFGAGDTPAFDRDILIDDASFNFEVFGYYGLSLWLTGSPWPLERILRHKTRRAARVALFTVGSLGEQGLQVVASGREPHFDTTDGQLITGSSGAVRITTGSASNLVDRFLAAAYTVEQNPFFEQDVR
jgi:hypothetical protein